MPPPPPKKGLEIAVPSIGQDFDVVFCCYVRALLKRWPGSTKISGYQVNFSPVVNVIKLYFGGNLDLPNIKKLKNVFLWTYTKLWKQCNFQAKLYSKTVYCFKNGLFCAV